MNSPVPISQFRESDGLVFTSGQVCLTTEGKLIEGTIQEQTHQVMKNLERVLKEAGVGFKDVLKTTIYVTDMNLAADVNEVYGSYFKEPFPAREMIGVSALPLGAKVEISMVAKKG
jgi:2-iminobutanoate/2-iminopropanoate deaminase